ncbi:hypothetical protein IE53DRAFT_192524, partial [Violaceomyces palustris]
MAAPQSAEALSDAKPTSIYPSAGHQASQSMRDLSSSIVDKGKARADYGAGARSQSASSSLSHRHLPQILSGPNSLPFNLLKSLVPPHLLEHSNRERLSASSLQIPFACFSAVLDAYDSQRWLLTAASSQAQGPSTRADRTSDFDILQTLQKGADLVGGMAAAKDIDIVIFLKCGDQEVVQASKPLAAKQDRLAQRVHGVELGVRFMFSCVLEKIVTASPHGSTVELDLKIDPCRSGGDGCRGGDPKDARDISCTLQATVTPPADRIAATPSSKLKLANLEEDASLCELLQFLEASVESEALEGDGEGETSLRHRYTVHLGLANASSISDGSEVPEARTEEKDETHVDSPQSDLESSPIARDPSDHELQRFAQSLRGKKIALHSRPDSVFGRYLTDWLASWKCDVVKAGIENQEAGAGGGPLRVEKTAVALTKGRPAIVSYSSDFDRKSHGKDELVMAASRSSRSSTSPRADTAVLDPVTGAPVTLLNRSRPKSTLRFNDKHGESGDASVDTAAPDDVSDCASVVPFSFVMIDDDIATLQRELLRIRSAVPMLQSALDSIASSPIPTLQRPVLQHRPKSSPQIEKAKAALTSDMIASGMAGPTSTPVSPSSHPADADTTQAIIYFTSLRSYRLTRETIQPIIDSSKVSGAAPLPEVMVLIKPIGARRLLTALHTVCNKASIDPYFSPIATSPLSPASTRAKSWWTSENHVAGDPDSRAETDEKLVDPWPTVAPISPLPLAVISPPQSEPEGAPMAEPAAQAPTPAKRPNKDVTGASSNLRKTSVANQSKTSPRAAAETGEGGGGSADTLSAPAVSSGGATSTSTKQNTSATNSPLPVDALEYFSETAARMGGSASSGMVIQSPDGRPAGIFFQPKTQGGPGSASGSWTPGSHRLASPAPTVDGRTPSPLPRSSSEAPSTAAARPAGEPERRSETSGSGATVADGSSLGKGPSSRSRTSSSRSSRSAVTESISSSQGRQYPSGSIFAPQVGIQSVLSGSQPPVATPLSHPSHNSVGGQGSSGQIWNSTGPKLANEAPTVASAALPSVGSAKPATGEKADAGQSDSGHKQVGGGTASAKQRSKASDAAISSVRRLGEGKGNAAAVKTTPKKGAGVAGPSLKIPNRPLRSSTSVVAGKGGTPQARNGAAHVGEEANGHSSAPTSAGGPMGASSTSAPSSPLVSMGGGAAGRFAARQSFAMAPSPSDSRRPSAQPQSGFMIGMGFAPTAKTGSGPKKAPVREVVLPPIKVLIVEDNPINQKILATFLNRKKIAHEVANNGREAVDKWQTGGFHLILVSLGDLGHYW